MSHVLFVKMFDCIHRCRPAHSWTYRRSFFPPLHHAAPGPPGPDSYMSSCPPAHCNATLTFVSYFKSFYGHLPVCTHQTVAGQFCVSHAADIFRDASGFRRFFARISTYARRVRLVPNVVFAYRTRRRFYRKTVPEVVLSPYFRSDSYFIDTIIHFVFAFPVPNVAFPPPYQKSFLH